MARVKRILVDFAITTTKYDITAIATTVELLSLAKFQAPAADEFYIATLTQPGNETSWEYVRVDGHAGGVATIVRGYQGTIAQAWVAGTRFELRSTSKDFLKPGTIAPSATAATATPGTSEYGARENHQHPHPNWSSVQGAPGVFGGSGVGHSSGFVPDPGSVAGASRFLCENGTYRDPLSSASAEVVTYGPCGRVNTIADTVGSVTTVNTFTYNASDDSVATIVTTQGATVIATYTFSYDAEGYCTGYALS